MPDVHKTALSLRFGGDDLDPRELSKVLGREPTLGVGKGEIWTTPKGNKIVASSGRWILKTHNEKPGNIDRQIAALFSGMTEDLASWRKYAERYEGNIFVGIFLSNSNEGISISPLTLNAIGLRGLEFGLDIYGGRDEQDDDATSLL